MLLLQQSARSIGLMVEACAAIAQLLFTHHGNHGAAPQGPGGGPEVRVAWIADDQLVVSYDKAVRVFRAETNLSGVRIRHETLVSKPG